jgi:hypothetical protein
VFVQSLIKVHQIADNTRCQNEKWVCFIVYYNRGLTQDIACVICFFLCRKQRYQKVVKAQEALCLKLLCILVQSCYAWWNSFWHLSLLTVSVKTVLHFSLITRWLVVPIFFKCFNPKDEHRVKVLKGRALGRVFGPKREYVTGDWKCMLCSPHIYYSDD